MNAPAPSAPAPAGAPPAAPAAAAPAPAGVAVDQNPVSAPAPVGSQAAPAPQQGRAGNDSRPESRREAIQRAFRKAEEAGRPGPAEAKPGHNQPPEATPRERPQQRAQPPQQEAKPQQQSAPSIDLRRPPPKRGDRGRFARADAATAAAAAAAPGGTAAPGAAVAAGRQRQQQPQQPAARVAPLPANAPFAQAPQRMSERARAEWAAAPESVRGEVHRMQQEFAKYHRYAKPQLDVMAEIKPFHDMAVSHGTTVAQALQNYVGMEQKLRSDPIGGLDVLVHNLNLRTDDGQQLGLRDIAHYVMSQTPEQHAAVQGRNVQGAQNVQLAQLTQTVSQLANSVQQMHHAQAWAERYGQMRGGVDRFAETHPRMDELSSVIVAELRAGHSLEKAYQRANLLHPANPAAQTRIQTVQHRQTDRSIHGAPDGGAGVPVRGAPQQRNGKAPSRRDSIARAINRVNGSF